MSADTHPVKLVIQDEDGDKDEYYLDYATADQLEKDLASPFYPYSHFDQGTILRDRVSFRHKRGFAVVFLTGLRDIKTVDPRTLEPKPEPQAVELTVSDEFRQEAEAKAEAVDAEIEAGLSEPKYIDGDGSEHHPNCDRIRGASEDHECTCRQEDATNVE